MRTGNKLRSLSLNRALNHCAILTAGEWSSLDQDETLDLWTVFRSYILNGYDDTHIGVPARITAVWGRCKAIIDKEAGI